MRNLTPDDLKRTEAMIEGAVTEDRLPVWVHKPTQEQLSGYNDATGSAMTILLMVACALAGMVVTLVLLTLAGRLR